GRVSEQPAARVVDQFLRGQPAHALDEAALDLAKVDRRVQRMADIVEDIDGNDPVFASERVDHNLAERRTIGEIEEGAAGMGGAVVMDLRRRVEAGRSEEHTSELQSQ